MRFARQSHRILKAPGDEYWRSNSKAEAAPQVQSAGPLGVSIDGGKLIAIMFQKFVAVQRLN
jgi:hypothetical protein